MTVEKDSPYFLLTADGSYLPAEESEMIMKFNMNCDLAKIVLYRAPEVLDGDFFFLVQKLCIMFLCGSFSWEQLVFD